MWTDLREEVKRYLAEQELASGRTTMLMDLIREYGGNVTDLFPLDEWVVARDSAVVRKAE